MACPQNWSKTGSWILKLYNILRPAPHDSLTSTLANSHSRFRHSPGDIWRHTFSTSVYNDLAGTALSHDSLSPVAWGRFVRVEHIGLSGVVLYEILMPPSTEHRRESCPPTDSGTPRHITLEGVFGNLSDSSDLGMNLDDLLDVVGAKIVYFPAYACTSFVVGQVMSAFFKCHPAYRPYPAYRGFSIRIGETYNTALPPNDQALSTCNGTRDDHDENDTSEAIDWNSVGTYDMLETLTLEADSPYTSLCIRTSKVCDIDSSGAMSETDSVISIAENTIPSGEHVYIRTKLSQTFTGECNICMHDGHFSFLDLGMEDTDT